MLWLNFLQTTFSIELFYIHLQVLIALQGIFEIFPTQPEVWIWQPCRSLDVLSDRVHAPCRSLGCATGSKIGDYRRGVHLQHSPSQRTSVQGSAASLMRGYIPKSFTQQR